MLNSTHDSSTNQAHSGDLTGYPASATLQAAKTSLIEMLGQRLDTLEAPRESDPSDEEAQLISDEQYEIFELLSFLRPKTARDILTLKRALSYHLYYMANGADEEDSEEAREERFAKAYRIQSAIEAFSEKHSAPDRQ